MLRYKLSPRYVLWLVEQLPDDSATAAAIRGGREHRGWTVSAYLAALTVDRLGDVWAAVQQPHSKKRIKPPARIPRPTARRRVVTRVRVIGPSTPLPD